MIMSQASDQSARGAGTPRLLLTVREAAEALAISRSKLYQLFAAGLVDSIRVDGSRRVPLAALETYIADRQKAEKAEAAA
jgi:excisionase family DNA binding protein